LQKIIIEMKKLLPIIISICSLLSCENNSESENTPIMNERTVIAYVSGENSLNSFVNFDLNEMQSGSTGLASSDRLVAFVDKASTITKPYIIEFKEGRVDTIMQYKEDFLASDPQQMHNIIKEIEELYPSKEYGLVLWGHCTGWLVTKDTIAQARPFKAYGPDNGKNSETDFGAKWMNITQVRSALHGLPKFKFIMGDCCCMMSIEAAYELRNVTDYLIGSPAEIPAYGAPYQTITKDLFLKSNDFYRQIIDDYYDHYLKEYPKESDTIYLSRNSLPMSVIDMRYVGELADATRILLKAPNEFTFQGVPFYFCLDLPVMYDMSCLMEKNTTAEDFATWRRSFEKAVPYRRMSNKWLSIYSELNKNMSSNSFIFNENTFGGVSMFVSKPEYNFSHYFLYNDGLKNFEWYRAVGWNRFEQ